MSSYQHDPRLLLHWTALLLGHMTSGTALLALPPVATVMMCAAVFRQVALCGQVVIVVVDGVEAVGMVTVWAAVGLPELRLSIVVDVVIGQLVVSI